MIKSDEQIKKDVVDELYWDTRIDASKVNVSVNDGIVTLTGEVSTYGDILEARWAALRMEGVVDVIDSLEVQYLTPPALPSDLEIQERATNLIVWDPDIDETKLTITVLNGVVTLEGAVDVSWKKPFVEEKVSRIRGIIGIENNLAVVPSMKITDQAIGEDIMDAFDRDFMIDPGKITATVNNGVVTLSGSVPNWTAYRLAEDDAFYTSGVIDVNNKLIVES